MKTVLILTAAVCALALQSRAQAPHQEVQQKVTMVREAVAQNQGALQHYTLDGADECFAQR